MSFQLFAASVNPLLWNYSIRLLLRDYQYNYIRFYKFCYRNINERLLNWCYTSGNISETARDNDIVTIDN